MGIDFSNHPFMQLLYGEDQIPVLAPHDVASFKGEGSELPGVKVFVVLQMRVTANKIADNDGAGGAVAEGRTDF